MSLLRANSYLFFGNLMWAFAFPTYTLLLPEHIEPLPLYTITIVVTALISQISYFSGICPKCTRPIEKKDILAIVVAALLIALIRKCILMFALSLTSSIDGAIISSLSPVVVLVIALFFGIERFSGLKFLGIFLGFAGALGVIFSSSSGAQGESGVLGNILMLCCALISAFYVTFFKHLTKKYEPMLLLRWMFTIAAIVALPIGAESVTKVDFKSFETTTWLAFAYLVLIPTYLPNLLLTSALKVVQPTVASIFTYVQPTVAVAISLALGLDRLRLSTAIFAMLIFAGVGAVIYASHKARQAAQGADATPHL